MKSVLRITSVILLIFSAQFSFAQNYGGWNKPQPLPWQGKFENLIKVFRSYHPTSGDHLYSLNKWEGPNAGYQLEGVGFQTFQNSKPSRRPLFRCYVAGIGHFASLESSCEGQKQEGILGYIEVRPNNTARNELVRCYNGRNHLITTNQNECFNAGYWAEGTLGYTP